jgi:hypothetical protein
VGVELEQIDVLRASDGARCFTNLDRSRQ